LPSSASSGWQRGFLAARGLVPWMRWLPHRFLFNRTLEGLGHETATPTTGDWKLDDADRGNVTKNRTCDHYRCSIAVVWRCNEARKCRSEEISIDDNAWAGRNAKMPLSPTSRAHIWVPNI
jgi:hypothetical protein